MATRKAASTALIPWEQEMAATAKVQAKAEKVDTYNKSIGCRGGLLTIDGAAVPGNALDVVILLAVHENKWYSQGFDPDNPVIPDCYAFGDPNNEEDPGADMVPHEQAPDKQADACDGCPLNEWGSAEKGRGKACKNVRRLVCMDASELEGTPKEIAAAEMRTLTLPVTSVANWGKYMESVADDTSRPSWGVVTTVSARPHPKKQFEVTFEFKELVQFSQESYDALKKKLADLKKNVVQPYVQFEPEEKPVKPVGRAKQTVQRVAAKQAANAPAAKARAGAKVGSKF